MKTNYEKNKTDSLYCFDHHCFLSLQRSTDTKRACFSSNNNGRAWDYAAIR
jgi:hypothetical protein